MGLIERHGQIFNCGCGLHLPAKVARLTIVFAATGSEQNRKAAGPIGQAPWRGAFFFFFPERFAEKGLQRLQNKKLKRRAICSQNQKYDCRAGGCRMGVSQKRPLRRPCTSKSIVVFIFAAVFHFAAFCQFHWYCLLFVSGP